MLWVKYIFALFLLQKEKIHTPKTKTAILALYKENLRLTK